MTIRTAQKCRRIIQTVATHYGLMPRDLRGSGQWRRVAWPRQVAAYMLRTYTDAALTDIGAALGGRHHTTIMASVRKVTDALGTGRGAEVARVAQAVAEVL